MQHDTGIILPWPPEPLKELDKREQGIRTESVLEINGDEKFKDHLDVVCESLKMIFELTKLYEHKSEDELTIQFLGIRLFNSIVCSLNLVLPGYYQAGMALERDVIETGSLLDFFSSQRTEIAAWKASDATTRRDKYGPAAIRQALDKRDGFKKKKRDSVYKIFCEYGAHPTSVGFNMTAQNALGEIGPFMRKDYLGLALEDLAMRVPLFALAYLNNFDKLPHEFLKAQSGFLQAVKNWSQRHLSLNLDHLGIDAVKAWVSAL